MKAAMVATGGLSGGISSTIAGGNFWDGFRQGIITSGLNHVAHLTAESLEEDSPSKLKKLVDREIKEAGKEGSQPSNYEDLRFILTKIKPIRALVGQAQKLAGEGLSYFIEKERVVIDDDGNKHYALGMTSDNGKIITLFKTSFSSWLKLAETVGAELNNSINILNGNYNMWINQYHNDEKAQYRLELENYKWRNEWNPSNHTSQMIDYFNKRL